MNQHKFVRLTPANCRSAYKIHMRAHFSPWSEAVFGDCLEDQYAGFSLVRENDLIGYYLSLFVLDEATLMDIGIASDLRGKGNAKYLIAHLVEQCKEKNMKAIWLEVRQSNLVAIKLYESSGFVVIETRKNYYPAARGHEDALVMKLNLCSE